MQYLYQVISTKLSTIDISKRWLILPYRLIGDMFWYLRCVYKIYLYVLLIQPLCHYQTYHTQRWNLLSICHLYHNNDVDKKHHRCTGDIVLKINVGTTRTRYSYQPKECRSKKKTASTHIHNHNLKERNHDKVSTTDQSSSSHNDVINTKPILAYSSQNLASRGHENSLHTLKLTYAAVIKMSTQNPPQTTPNHLHNH